MKRWETGYYYQMRREKKRKTRKGKMEKGHDTISARLIKIRMKLNDSRPTKKPRIANIRFVFTSIKDKILINFY